MTVHRWVDKLHEADVRLRAGQFSESLAVTRPVLEDMEKRMQGGKDAASTLGLALLLRGVAETALGSSADGLWDLRVATLLDPAIEQVDLSVYGPPGDELRRLNVGRVFGARDQAAAPSTAPALVQAAAPAPAARDASAVPQAEIAPPPVAAALPIKVEGEVTRPRRIATPRKPYFPGLQHSCQTGQVLATTVLDTQGRVQDFKLVNVPSPLMTLWFLEMIRTWRYSPATLAGKPVSVFWDLSGTVQFPGCVPKG